MFCTIFNFQTRSRELMGLEELAEIIRQSAKDGVEDFDSLGNDDEMIFEDGV